MTKFHDPRAAAIASQIDAINQAGFEQAYDPLLQHHMVYGGLSPLEGTLRCDMFLNRARETAQKREVVWTEQVEQNISGIEWYTVEYGGISAELPRLHEDLKLVPGDKEILMDSKPEAFKFLAHWQKAFKLWHFNSKFDEPWQQTQWRHFYTEYLQREWLEIWVEDDISKVLLLDGTEVEQPVFAINTFCYWGNPSDVHCTEAILSLAQHGFSGIILRLGGKSDRYQ